MNSNLLSLAIFVITLSITPGPNNVLLTASGVAFGIVKTMPHILGVIFGIFCLNILSALGISKIMLALPGFENILKYIGVAYMMYLAYKMFLMRNKGCIEDKSLLKPFTFIKGAIFQFLNPKALFMTISAMSVFTIEDNFFQSASIVIIVFVLLGLPSITVWAAFGTILRKFLNNKKRSKVFYISISLLTGFSGILLVT